MIINYYSLHSTSKRKIILFLILFILLIIEVGCSMSNADPLDVNPITSISTQTPYPTYTPYPTLSALPTYTPYPTFTPLPTIPSVSESWNHYRITYRVSLDGYRGYQKVWMPIPTDGVTQQGMKLISVNPTPEDIYFESKGNRIIYWNENIQEDNYEFVAEFDVYILKKEWDISPENVGNFNPNDPILRQYLNPSEWVQSDHPEIIVAAHEIIGTETNPYNKVLIIADWLQENMNWIFPEEDAVHREDALTVLRTKEVPGCGAAAHIFVALSRAAGVPARIVSGIGHLKPGIYSWAERNFGTHLWTEFYLPDYGWIPADILYLDGMLFAESEGDRLILSRGSDIILGYGMADIPWFHLPYVDYHQEPSTFLEVEFLGNEINPGY